MVLQVIGDLFRLPAPTSQADHRFVGRITIS